MSQVGERKVVLFPSTAVAAGTVADTKPLCVANYTSAIIILNVSAISTGTTLDVYIQQEMPVAGASDKSGNVPSGTSVWNDFAHFTQVTTSTGTWSIEVTSGGNTVGALKDAALGAGSVISGPIGSNWRVKYVSVGTSYTFGVTAILIP